MTSWPLALFLAFCVSAATSEDPCLDAVDVSNPKRAPINANTQDVVELCDSDLQGGKWYYLGGEISDSCVDFNRCNTFSGIWYQGNYPTGNEIVSGKVCAKVDRSSCCGWSGTIKVKKCRQGYVYQLAIPTECPMSYCVGEAIPCPKETVFDRDTGTCVETPKLQKAVLSNPYISAYKLFGTFNATMFSVDCELNSTSSVMANSNGKLKVETVFKMNEQEIAKFVSDYPVTRVALEETYLVGHIGKTLTCEAQLYYDFGNGSFSTRTSLVKSSGYYFGIEAIDASDVVIKEIRIQQGVTKDIYFRSTFPITYGHCVLSNQCHVEKYSFVTSAMRINVRRDQCQIHFENRLGKYVFRSSKPIQVSVLMTPGIEHSTDALAFAPFNHLFNGTIFQGFIIPPIQVIIAETQKQPTCHSVGDPHFQSFHGVTFDNYLSGDFNLLSTKHRTFQIQVRQYFCVGQISCNCGVIAREGNNLIGINACDNRTVPVVFQLMKDDVNPTASLKITNYEYYIQFVSGISIKINLFGYPIFMNIYVNGLKHEQYEGICSVTAPPANFNVYRIAYAESFFKSQLPPCVNEVFKFPECKCFNDSQDAVSTVCEFSQSQQDSKMVVFENICDVKKRMKNVKRHDIDDDDHEEVPLSVESKISKEGLTIDDIFSTLDRNRDQENFKDVELMSLTEAQDHCLRILEKIQFSEKCREFLGDRHQALQKNCIDDVKLSGRADIAQTYLNIYEEVCMTTLAKEVTIVDGEKSPESKEIIDVLKEMNSTFNERQRNSIVPWEQETTTTSKVGESCPMDAVIDRDTGSCLEFPQLQKPILSNPYISSYKMFGTFNATMFSVDCELNSTSSVMANINGKLKVETVFRMNGQEIAKFVSDFPVLRVILEETYLVGHIGKTLTCEAQLFFEFNDGSFSTRTSAVSSSGYYFGIEAVDTNDVVMKEIRTQQGVTTNFYLRSTFPITYGHCVKSDKCLVQKYSFAMSAMRIGVRRNDCQIHFENPLGHYVFRSSKPIQVSVLLTPGIEHSTDAIAFAPFMHLFNGTKTIFYGFLIPPIQVVVVESLTRPTCHSVADPHFMSFHGVYFDNYFSGDFNLLSAKNRTFQIQVRQIFCVGRVSCNCGVIAREGNNLIGINVCDYRSVPVVFQMMRDNVNPAASVELINNEFHMKFASGVSIKVSLYKFGSKPTSYLNIYVHGLKHEQYDGICSAISTPPDFNVYRIPLSKSFFKSQLPSCVNEVFRVPECKCVIDQQNVMSAVCGFSPKQQDTGMVVFENICDVKKGKKKDKRSVEDEEVSLAVESKTSKEGITLDDIFNTVDRRRDDEDFKEVELMPLNEAQVHCSRVLEKSKFSSYCRQFLGDKHEALQKNCIDDVKLSGTAEAAETYLNIYEEVCMTTLAKEVEIVDGEKSPDSKEVTDVLAEMNTTFTERQLNATVPWKQDTKPGSILQKLLENLKMSHVLVFSGTILVTGTAAFAFFH